MGYLSNHKPEFVSQAKDILQNQHEMFSVLGHHYFEEQKMDEKFLENKNDAPPIVIAPKEEQKITIKQKIFNMIARKLPILQW
jgi:UDP-N-acetyl-D-mannosaminuronic acid transferase (WecB/TagA/CpsF family)